MWVMWIYALSLYAWFYHLPPPLPPPLAPPPASTLAPTPASTLASIPTFTSVSDPTFSQTCKSDDAYALCRQALA